MNDTAALGARNRPLIAIVEDDPGVRRSLQMLFTGQGFDVRACASGEALTSNGAFGNPACLISDYKLEGQDGIELLCRLRSEGWQGPAVLITGFPSDELSARAATSGYAALFEKPLRQRSLTETVSRLVRAWHAGPSNGPTAK